MTRHTQAEATRDALLESARTLWGAKGFFATSIADIVEHAGVGTRGAFYHHFKDREELFLAVFADAHDRLAAELIPKASTETDPLTRLAASLGAFLEIASRSPDIQALLIDGPAVFGITRWHELEQMRGRAVIEAHLEEAAALGILTDQPVRPLAELLLILVNGAGLAVAAQQDSAHAQDQTGAALAALVEGLRARP